MIVAGYCINVAQHHYVRFVYYYAHVHSCPLFWF